MTLEAAGGKHFQKLGLFVNEAFDIFPGSRQIRPRPLATGQREEKWLKS